VRHVISVLVDRFRHNFQLTIPIHTRVFGGVWGTFRHWFRVVVVSSNLTLTAIIKSINYRISRRSACNRFFA